MRTLARIARTGALIVMVGGVAGSARAGIGASDWQFAELWEDSEVSTWRLPPAIWLEAHGRICQEILDLTPDQGEALAGIVEGAEKEFMYTWLERKESLIDDDLKREIEPEENTGKNPWREQWKKQLAVRAELHEIRQRLSDQILTDLRAVVTQEQSERWPELERAMRRSFTLVHMANLRLEGLDLDALVRSLDPPEDVRTRVDPILKQYLIDLDPLIAARDTAAESLERDAREARTVQEEIQDAEESADAHLLSKGKRAGAAAVRAASSVLDASKRIADLNAMTLTQLQQVLPAEMSAEIEKAASSPLYTRQYNSWNQSQAHAALHLAENLSTFSDSLSSENLWSGTAGTQSGVNRIRKAVKPLTEEQAARIHEIRKKFEDEDRAIRSRMEPEEDADPSRATWMDVRVESGTVGLVRREAQEEASEKRQKREKEFRKKQAELVLGTLKEVREVLDPEQRMLIAAFMW